MQNTAALITLVAYSGLLLLIGLRAARRTNSESDYLLGGRNLGPVVSGLAYAASTSSAWVLIGFSGFVYAVGSSALWMVPGILAGYAAVWLFAGPVLQRASREKGHLTLTDFLSEGASPVMDRAIRWLVTGLILFCFSWYVAAQFQGAGQALNDLFGTGLTTGVLIGAGIILVYTLVGGFLAVSLIDTVQGLLIALVAILLPIPAWMAAREAAFEPSLFDAAYMDPAGGREGWIAIGFVVGLAATGFGALGQPHLAAWVMAARDHKARLIGAGVAIGWGAVVYAGMAVLGLSARAIFGADAPAEGVFFNLATNLLPEILAGVIAAAVLSAIMSTVDSQLLVAGAAIGHDLCRPPSALAQDSSLASRLAVLGVCIAAVLVTLFLPSSIFDRVLFAWTALGGSLGPVVVARALGLRLSGAAVFSAILLGFVTAVLFEFILAPGPGGVWVRTLPWLAGAVVLAIAHLMRPRTRVALGKTD